MITLDPRRPAVLEVNGVPHHLTPSATRALRLLLATPGQVVSHQALNGAIHAQTWVAVSPLECPPEPVIATETLRDVISELRAAGVPLTTCHRRGYAYTPHPNPANFEYYPAEDSCRRPANLEA